MAIDDGLTELEKRELLKELKEAYFTGAKRIRFNERDVIYRTLEEMNQIIGRLEDELAPSSRRRSRSRLTSFGSGL